MRANERKIKVRKSFHTFFFKNNASGGNWCREIKYLYSLRIKVNDNTHNKVFK